MGRGLLRFRYSTPSENQNTIPIYCPSMLGLHFTHLGWSYYPYTLFPTICCPQLLSNNFTSNSNIFKTSYLSYCFWKHICLPLYNPSPLFFVNRILVSCRHLYTYPSSPRNYHYSQSRGKSWLIAYHSPERGLIQYGYSFASERWGGISWGNFWEKFLHSPSQTPTESFSFGTAAPVLWRWSGLRQAEEKDGKDILLSTFTQMDLHWFQCSFPFDVPLRCVTSA